MAGQNKKLDSLFTVLKKAKEDTTKINTLNLIAYEFRNSKPDTAANLANQALVLSKKNDYTIGEADAYLWIGTANINLGNYPEALKQLTNAKIKFDQLLLTEAKNTSKIKKDLASTINNIGNVYSSLGNHPKALENYLASSKIRVEIGNNNGIATSYLNIGNVFYAMGNFSSALENHFASLKIYNKIQDKPGIANSYNNIGGCIF